jgi:acyl-CoA synthetase (AMP-forming)/AMP-acid ligase II
MQGHYPMVVVELTNVEDKEAVCKEIYQICLQKLEERGQPVAVIPIDKVPITGAGKNDYRTLEKEYVNFDYLAWQAKL